MAGAYGGKARGPQLRRKLPKVQSTRSNVSGNSRGQTSSNLKGGRNSQQRLFQLANSISGYQGQQPGSAGRPKGAEPIAEEKVHKTIMSEAPQHPANLRMSRNDFPG